MDNQDQRRTQAHTAGQESHGVHLCHKCGWPFPNPHPSAKHRRAHKKICGTVEGYKLFLSEGQTHLNGSDDEHVSDDDHKTPGLVVSGPNSLDTGKNEKGNDGVGEKLIRSEDDVFSDAVADFSDSGLSPEIKERLQEDSLDSGTDVERVDIKEPKFSGSSGDKDFDAGDVSQLIVKSTEDCQTQNPNILRSESDDERNTVELQGQLSGPIVDSLSNTISDLRSEDLIIVDSDESSDSPPIKAEAMPDTLPVKNIYSGQNVVDWSLISDAKETNLKEKDEINSNRGMVESVESFDNVVGEKCEGVSEIAVSDVVSWDHQVGDRSVHLKEKDGAEINSSRDVVEIVESSYNAVGVTFEGVSEIAVSDLASLDHQFSDGAVNLKEKNDAELLSLLPQGLLESKSVVITTHDGQGDFAHVVQFATSVDDKISQGKEEGNVNVDPLLTCDDRTDVAHHQSEYGDFDHKGVVSQNPFIYSSESSKHEEDDFKDAVTEENNFHFNTSKLSEKSDVLSPDMHVVDRSSMKMEPNSELLPEMHAEECITVESYQRSDEIDASTNAMKTEINENHHMVHFSEVHRPDNVCEDSQQISLPEGSLMALSNESQRDAFFGSAISETTNVINRDNINSHEKNRIEINDVAVDGKVVDVTVENVDIILKDVQPGEIMQSEVKQSDYLFKSDDAGEIGKTERDISDAQYTEMAAVKDTSSPKSSSSHLEVPAISEVGNDGLVRKSNVTECTIINPLSGAQEDIKEDEISVNIKLNEEYNKFVDTSADLHQAQDAELSVKAAEHVTRSYTSSPLNTVPSTQHDSAVDNPGGEPGREVSGITAVPVQGQTGNNLDKLSSSGVDVSIDSGSRCDSLEGNWGSVSVLSMQSDAPAVIEAETLPSNGLLASTEEGKSNLNNPKSAAPERQPSGKSEMFEPPSFMTLVEPRQVSPKASEIEKGQSPQQPDPTSQAGWFPTLTQVVNESQGRKKNEEIIAKVTNWSTSKEHTNLKSLLGEAAHSNKPKSPKGEEKSMNQKNSKVPENNGSGLTTVNSILGPESPAAQTVKGDAAKEWNSPARYPADIKREKRKVKSRPYWIQLVCCTSVDHQRR
ncbi:uncharacterized protein LOC113854859 isoform X2 [Abrus precatorius]|uniref:Uncharacterized protein LOC113854859 isoform X2 n=1 Tax=Abrus precatorius TaxID=3816 RepID=A0A8B8KFE7_ABRPR|nr:uncharacterized protein LOC113854859 isoform X2 [Abrus precatorius]